VALALALPASGGVRVEPRVRLIAEARYDDDALLAAGGRGQLVSKLMPQVGGFVAGPTFEGRAWYSPDLALRHGSGTFTVDHRGALVAHGAFSERASMAAALRLWRVTDSTSLPRSGVARTPAPVLYGRGEIATRLRVTERWTAGLFYALEAARLYDGRTDAGWVHAPAADAWYRLSRRTEVGLEYRLQRFSLGREQATAHAATVAGRFRFSRRIHGLWRAGPGLYRAPGDRGWRPFPRATLEFGLDGDRVDLALAAGHDLVGASGFTSALWADHVSATADWRASAALRLFAAASAFRNGRAPDLGWGSPGGGLTAQGAAVGGGAEWTLRPGLSVQVSAERYAQTGLSRTVVAARLLAIPFRGGPEDGW
jgi:hypothetical protein